MNCKQCGRQIPDGALFCKYCGTRVESGEEVRKGNGRNVEKGQKGVRRGAARKGSGLVVALVVILILAIGILAAVLIWKNSAGSAKDDGAQQTPSTSESGEAAEDGAWTASLLPENGEVEVGKNLMLNATVDQELGSVTVRSVTWQSSNTAAATVADGIVYGIAAGKTTITAKLALSDGSSVECRTDVTVIEEAVVYTAKVTPDSASMKVGDTTTLIADLEQDLQEGVEVVSTVWSSDNKNVAVVSNGKVSAIGAGTANISVTINLSNAQAASANAQITVAGNQPAPDTGNNNTNNNNTGNNTGNGGNTANGGNGGNSGPATNPGISGNGEHSTYNAYVLPGSDSSVYSYDTLRGLSAWELRVARNEIYARHGRMFESAELQAHFNSKSWYNGYIPADQFNAGVLNSVELENLKRIQEVEAGR